MPKYLAIDFLAQALRQKDLLLSHMLLSCPGTEDIEQIFQKNENYNSEKQSNWPKHKAKPIEFVHEKLNSCLSKLLTSSFGKKPECFEVKRDIVFVPSSNPGSPVPSFSDSLSELEVEIVQDVCDYLDRKEINNAVPFLEDNDWEKLKDEKQLEEMVVADCFAGFLRRIPHFLDLASRLKPGRVTDPFLDKTGQLRSHRQLICSKFSYAAAKESIREEFKEEFRKYSLDFGKGKNKTTSLSSPVLDYSGTRATNYLGGVSELADEKDEGQLDNRINDLQRTFKCQKWSERERYEIVLGDLSQEEISSFVQMNETVLDLDLVNPLPGLVLESPPLYNNIWSEIADEFTVTENVDLPPFNINTEQPMCLFSPEFQYSIARKIDTSSKLLDKISSLILQVPDLKEKWQNQQATTLYNFSILSKEEVTSELELTLCWDPVSKSSKASVSNLQYIDDDISNTEPTHTSPPLTTVVTTIPWKDVYACSDSISTKQFDVIEETKKRPAVVVLADQSESPTDIERNVQLKIEKPPTGIEKNGQLKIEKPPTGIEKNGQLRIARKPVDIGKYYNNINSGIDDFMLLRTIARSSTSTYNPPKAIVKAVTFGKECSRGVNDDSLRKAKNTEQLEYTVKVPLCKDYQSIFTTIQQHIRPIMLQLQETGSISSSYTIDNLTSDYTRFILKQEEKRNSRDSNGNGGKRYRMLVALHALVTARDLLKECGLAVTRDYVRTISVQYRKALAGDLDQLMAELAGAEQRFSNLKLDHPKVIEAYEIIRRWLQQTTLVEKILIVVFRGFKEISSALLTQLNSVKGLYTAILDEKPAGFSVINNTHVVITDVVGITEHFPWSSFTSVIFYEEKHEWLQKVLKEMPEMKHVLCLKGEVNINQQTQNECEDAVLEDKDVNRDKYTLIGSTKITRNIELLVCLEQKNDIIIIEREYDKILKGGLTTPSKMCQQPDLLLDEKAGVIIENIIDFATEEGYKKVVDLVLSISFKCQMCNIILCCETNGGSAYSFFGEVQSNLAKFQGCLVSIQSSFPHFVIDVFYSHSVQQTATFIRRLCEITKDSSNEFSKKNWMERNWLTDEITAHERFLLGFPSLNSFSAQRMLSTMPLNMLLTLPFITLKNELPWIPDSILKNFKKMVGQCGSVVEQDNGRSEFRNSEIPRFPEDEDVSSNYETCTDIQDNDDVSLDSCKDFESTSEYFTEMPSSNTSSRKPNLELGLFGGSSLTNQDLNITTDSRNAFPNGYNRNKVEGPYVRNTNYLQYFPRQPDEGSNLPHVQSNFELARTSRGFPPAFNNSTCNRGNFKPIKRSSKTLRSGNEMSDVVGVVQPKPRKVEKPTIENSTQFRLTPRNDWDIIPQYSQKIPNSNILWQGTEGPYEKPKKKRKLTFEIVPGAKNGQTRLTFV